MHIDEMKHRLWMQGVPHETAQKFIKAFQDSPEVWREFEAIALRLAQQHKRVGAKSIIERVRWETEIEQGKEWKVNNNWAPYYARAFEIKHPRFSGFFEKREIKGVNA